MHNFSRFFGIFPAKLNTSRLLGASHRPYPYGNRSDKRLNLKGYYLSEGESFMAGLTPHIAVWIELRYCGMRCQSACSERAVYGEIPYYEK